MPSDDPPIIVFVGTVGSGKSTQMKLLAQRLRSEKRKVKTTCIKTGHIFAYILMIILAKMLVRDTINVHPIRSLLERGRNLFRKIFKLFTIIDLLSIVIRFMVSIYIPKKLGYLVLVEEYLLATIADRIYLAKNVGVPLCFFESNFILRLFKISGPILTVFLDAEDWVLKKRWIERNSPPERPEYLQAQRSLLLMLSRAFSDHFLYIDTTDQTEKETCERIVSYLKASKVIDDAS